MGSGVVGVEQSQETRGKKGHWTKSLGSMPFAFGSRLIKFDSLSRPDKPNRSPGVIVLPFHSFAWLSLVERYAVLSIRST